MRLIFRRYVSTASIVPSPSRMPDAPRLRVVNLQVLVAVAMIVGGAYVFVDAVEHIAGQAGLDPTLLALVVAPIATELPEKFNSLIWVRQGKDTLAMGNITGAMVFQSCIPTAIGVVLAASAWTITQDSLLSFASAGIAFASTAAIFVPMVRRGSVTGRHLLVGGLFYVVYVGARGRPSGRAVVTLDGPDKLVPRARWTPRCQTYTRAHAD